MLCEFREGSQEKIYEVKFTRSVCVGVNEYIRGRETVSGTNKDKESEEPERTQPLMWNQSGPGSSSSCCFTCQAVALLSADGG